MGWNLWRRTALASGIFAVIAIALIHGRKHGTGKRRCLPETVTPSAGATCPPVLGTELTKKLACLLIAGSAVRHGLSKCLTEFADAGNLPLQGFGLSARHKASGA